MMAWVALMLTLWLAGNAGPEPQSPTNPSCKFSVAPSTAAPTITGPDEVTSRLHVVNQPDSPVEILTADFAGTQLTINGNNYTFNQNASPTLEVRNVSDQRVRHVDTRVSVGSCQNLGRGGAPPRGWDGLLNPGATTRIQNTGSGGGSGSSAGSLLVFLWIDRVDFAECIYRPAQVIPKSICGAEAPGPLIPYPPLRLPQPGRQ